MRGADEPDRDAKKCKDDAGKGEQEDGTHCPDHDRPEFFGNADEACPEEEENENENPGCQAVESHSQSPCDSPHWRVWGGLLLCLSFPLH